MGLSSFSAFNSREKDLILKYYINDYYSIFLTSFLYIKCKLFCSNIEVHKKLVLKAYLLAGFCATLRVSVLILQLSVPYYQIFLNKNF